jgi:hypothetical protein
LAPQAVRVLDASFHVVRRGFAAVDDVRRRIHSRNRPGTAAAATIRSTASAGCCARGHDHHTARSFARLLAGLHTGDTAGEQLASTWIAAQERRLILAAPDRARTEQAFHRWLVYCAYGERFVAYGLTSRTASVKIQL